MGLLILFFLVSIVFSFLCSIWEAVLLSITPATVEIKYYEGKKVGKLLKEFKENIDKPLSAILTLNTIAHTVGAIGVGAQAFKLFGEESLVASIVVPVLMTLAILILSELIPKTLGANSWQQLMNFTVLSLDIVIKALYPLVWLGNLITRALKKDKQKSVLSRSDFSAMASIGEKQGVFKREESKIIQNLVRFHTITAREVMTPRTVVQAAQEDMTIQEFYDTRKDLYYSRIPVYSKSRDHINGFILKAELLTHLVNDEGTKTLGEIKRKILVAKEDDPIPDIFNKLLETKEHISLVVDEFGGMSGLITLEDILETLLGLEIVDELDGFENMQDVARRRWEQRSRDLGIIKRPRDEDSE